MELKKIHMFLGFDNPGSSLGYGDVTEYLSMPQHYVGWFIATFAFITALTFIARGLARIFAPHRVPSP